MGAFTTKIRGIVRERASKRCKILTFNAGVRVMAIAVDAVLRGRIVGNRLFCTMGAKFMAVIYPPATSMFGMVTGVIVCTSADFANSIHNK